MGRLWKIVNGRRIRTAAGRRHEYDKFQSSDKAKKDRASRNSARRSAIREGLVRVHDGKDVHHKRGVEAGNAKSNLRVEKASVNRSHSEKSRKRGSGRNKSRWGR